MGGSTVFTDTVKFEQSHARILESLLVRHYPPYKIEVQNAGVPWHTSHETLIKLLTQVQDFDPDLLIVWQGINDLIRGFEPDRFSLGHFQEDYSHFYGSLKGMIDVYTQRYSSLFNVQVPLLFTLKNKFKETWTSDFSPKVLSVSVAEEGFRSLGAFRRNMENIIRNAKLQKSRLILASQPALYHDGMSAAEKEKIFLDELFMVENGRKPDISSLSRGIELFNQVSQSLAEKHGVDFIDLAAIVPKQSEYFLDDVHYTKAGNRIIGETLADYIIIQRIVEDRMGANLSE